MCYSIERLPVRELDLSWIKDTFDTFCIEWVLNSDIYQNSFDYRSQCQNTYTLLRTFGWSKCKVAKLFAVDHKAFEKQLSLPLENNENGRPPLLNEEEQQLLFQKIQSLLASNKHPTLYDIEQISIQTFKKFVSVDTLRNYIINSEKFRIVDGEPQDEDRVNVNMADINNYYTDLEMRVNGVPASLVFNMDEAGQDDYVDTHSMKVIVDASYTKSFIKIPVRRSTKRSTLVHCICCDGSYSKPLVIIPRKTVDSILLKKLTCQNVYLKFQSKGFTTTEIMKFWLKEIFFPFLDKKWEEEHQRTGYSGNAILILDGLAAHAAALKDFDLQSHHLIVQYLVPHSSHLTQPLDLVTFSLQKLITIKKSVKTKLSTQADQIRNIIKGIQQASTSESIVGAFESAGIFHIYNRNENISFNNYMPRCVVKKEFSRVFKEEGVEYILENFRINF